MSDERHFRLGTVGRPLPETEVRIAEDGEILVRHPGIFLGYWRDEENTRRPCGTAGSTREMWARSTGRDISDHGPEKGSDHHRRGKNIAPQYIENLLKFSPYINDAVVIGDGRKFLAAIIVIDEENVVKFARTGKYPIRPLPASPGQRSHDPDPAGDRQGERSGGQGRKHPEVPDPG
jgi:long-chain acyl-CoA synthetase